MVATWQVQEAKNRFSEVIERAVQDGPQVVTRHGRPVVRVVAVTAHDEANSTPEDGFADFLLSMPKAEAAAGLPAAPRRNRRERVKLGD
jgi:prevent-host-death family protein